MCRTDATQQGEGHDCDRHQQNVQFTLQSVQFTLLKTTYHHSLMIQQSHVRRRSNESSHSLLSSVRELRQNWQHDSHEHVDMKTKFSPDGMGKSHRKPAEGPSSFVCWMTQLPSCALKFVNRFQARVGVRLLDTAIAAKPGEDCEKEIRNTPGRVRPMLQHVLDDIVAVLIGGKWESGLQDLAANECCHVLNGAVLQHPLHHPAAIGVGGQTHHTTRDILHA